MDINSIPLYGSLEELVNVRLVGKASFNDRGLVHNYIYRKDSGNKKLLVFLPSALPRHKRRVPAFHRWSWMQSFEGFDALCISDPTLLLDHEILGGWMQGTKDSWALDVFLEHISYINKNKNYESIVFSGSSLGGFVALQAATVLSNRIPEVNVRFYAENPQISLPLYWIERHMNHLAKVCYGVSSLKNVSKDFYHRLDIVELMIRSECSPKGVLIIKESDEHHYNVQFDFLKKQVMLDDLFKVEVIPKELDESGHTPLTLEQMQDRLRRYF